MNKIVIFLLITVALSASSVEVSVIKPIPNQEAILLQADGFVVAKHTTMITSKAEGILKLFIEDNTEVRKGQKLAEIVDERRAKRLQLFRSRLLMIKSELQAQKAKLDDAQEMFQMGVGSKNSYLNEQLLHEQLQERYQTSKNSYEILQLEQKNALIYAQEDGTVRSLNAKNSYVRYGSTIATLLTKEKMIKLFVDVTYAKELHKGMHVRVESSYKNTQAVISDILPHSTNNLIEVMAKSNTTLPLNLQINAEIVLKKVQGFTLPKSAIVLVDNRPAIYLIEDAKATLHFVSLIKDMIKTVLVEKTFDKESRVAVKNAYMLHDGLEVLLK